MNRLVLMCLAFSGFACQIPCTSNGADSDQTTQAERRAVMPQKHAKLFREHCYECHDSSSEEAGVNLESISYVVSENVGNAGKWQKILNAINSGEMPPPDNTPLPDEDKLSFLEDLTKAMVESRRILGDNGGVVPLRRLNRREYANTMHQLLGVRPDISSLPNDQVGAGFDTQGASLFMSSDQIEQYLSAARQALTVCFESKAKARQATRRVEPELEWNKNYQDYVDTLISNAKTAREFLAQNEKPASAFGLIDEYQAKGQIKQYESWHPQLSQYLSWPETKQGISLVMTIKAGGMTRVKLPPLFENRPGRYVVRVRAAMYPDAAERFHYLEFSSVKGKQRTFLGWRKVEASLDDPQIVEFPIDHAPGERLDIQIHQRSHQDRGDKSLWTRAQKENGVGLPPGIWIDWAEVSGPDPDPALVAARDRILLPRRDDESEKKYVKRLLDGFVNRAFRGRIPTDAYMDQLHQHYQTKRDSGETLSVPIVEPMAIALSSPEFLYMPNQGRTDQPKRLSPMELAVRLSYMLWSAAPDDELIQAAQTGQLDDPAVLRAQTQRLLRDPRSENFVRDFTHQWLQMERLGMFQFNGLRFPTFDNAVREGAREEIFQMVKLILRDDLPLGDLLDAEYVVVNDLMAGYYGIEGVNGHQFRQVSIAKDSVRGGLLGTAAVAAMGSDGLRSSPVERGAWVLRHLLHDPPAPAPPNVPQLSRLEGEPLSSREMQRLHQEQPQCAQCHRKIDPIGFGLENFDADGSWRGKQRVLTGKIREAKATSFVEFEIDPSGTLPGGETFSNFSEMRTQIASKHDDFTRGFIEELISYGMGRPFGFTDETLCESMMQRTRAANYSISSIIDAFVQSPTFQSR